MDFGLCFVVGLVVILFVIAWIRNQSNKSKTRKFTSSYSRGYSGILHSDSDNIQDYGINEILSSGKFTPTERAAEYRRRGKSPSGVIDGEYNDEYRGNDEYNDIYRDWDADA